METTTSGPVFCKKTQINVKSCPCKKCTRKTLKVGADDLRRVTRRLPALTAEAHTFNIKANVYVNFGARGKDGMAIFLDDLAGLPLPEFHENQAVAKYDDAGNIVSPYYAWQATISMPADSPAIPEIEAIYGKDKIKMQGSTALVHSNDLAKFVLDMKKTQAEPIPMPQQDIAQAS